MAGLYPRHLRSLAAASDTPSFTIVQFNVLADGLSGLRDDLGGFTLAPPGSLAWAHRRQPLLDEILRFAPDIVCLEEVDHFYDWFEPQLAAQGYTGVFAPKPHSPCLQVSDQRDGCAVFVNTRFRIVRHDVLSYACYVPPDTTTHQPQNQVALLVELALHDSTHEVLVACTHLKAAKDAAGEAIRTQEAAMLCRALSAKQGAGHAIVVCGDFNAVSLPTPAMPATTYATMVEDYGYAIKLVQH
ncbi:hypothetical protein SDRG_00323 [Saprolegnia diclina VS20]|uniref:Endonuclease/exonuclease/phosphatase domain-containing protein n=1 Tax=Saprolegnia diclina (strain VS20) TaxID=1156394 RepID=T0QWJ3_SAPDV|nr:hypothetical protein SDRG_00323 [Saprolegnia diclina VS20]EQC42594.1 hypothetical protein SDRG_00323 [Saprolegnia diclina VS20]|eukprot:XP_008604017.1 hypothetical protein SDRG_00323 [Saprolegnia diclina VS20]